MPYTLRPLPLLVCSLLFFGCEENNQTTSDGGILYATTPTTGEDGGSGSEDISGDPPDTTADDTQGEDAGQNDPDTPLPAPPEPPPYSGGECPTLRAGRNTISSDGRDREFLLYLPPEPTGAPLTMLWHPLGGSANYIARAFDAEAVSAERQMIIAAPESCCSPQSEWGYAPGSDTSADLTLFDDLLRCIDDNFDVDNRRVYVSGFSAGAFWSTYLLLNRSEYLASAAIFSGGVGSGLINYMTPLYPLPVLLVDGGPTDIYGGFVNFNVMTAALRDNLRADGHTLVHCEHTGGHSLPVGFANWGLSFLQTHSYADGSSPYDGGSLGPLWPDYCTIPQ